MADSKGTSKRHIATDFSNNWVYQPHVDAKLKCSGHCSMDGQAVAVTSPCDERSNDCVSRIDDDGLFSLAPLKSSRSNELQLEHSLTL
jgi:hypothetical protein